MFPSNTNYTNNVKVSTDNPSKTIFANLPRLLRLCIRDLAAKRRVDETESNIYTVLERDEATSRVALSTML